MLEKDGYTYRECPHCGLVFIDPQPEQAFLAEEVYSEKAGYQKGKTKDLSQTRLDGVRARLLGDIQRLKPDGRLLDVGCSSGKFLYHAKKAGFDVAGVELNALTAEIGRANGLDVKVGTLEEARFGNAEFDVVFLGDIIEHIRDPRAFVKEAARVLKENGLLVIVTPNLDSRWAKMGRTLYAWFGIPWSSLTPPYHLFQFSVNNLEMLLNELGFTVKKRWFHRPPTLKYELGSLHLWGKYKQEKTLRNLLLMLFAYASYTQLYLIDMILVPFSKKDFGMVMMSRRGTPSTDISLTEVVFSMFPIPMRSIPLLIFLALSIGLWLTLWIPIFSIPPIPATITVKCNTIIDYSAYECIREYNPETFVNTLRDVIREQVGNNFFLLALLDRKLDVLKDVLKYKISFLDRSYKNITFSSSDGSKELVSFYKRLDTCLSPDGVLLEGRSGVLKEVYNLDETISKSRDLVTDLNNCPSFDVKTNLYIERVETAEEYKLFYNLSVRSLLLLLVFSTLLVV
ncbi:MAG: class I SAM-dependent methyltransferase, partial [Parcubacteria group bacterium]|nr:class I SAM-dependent methyltransferase [Parcubacteria group bacterium]